MDDNNQTHSHCENTRLNALTAIESAAGVIRKPMVTAGDIGVAHAAAQIATAMAIVYLADCVREKKE